MTTAVPARPMTLTESVCGLLSILGRGGGRLEITGRSRHGVGQRQLFLPVDSIAPDWIPEPLLLLLEEDLWALSVRVVARQADSTAPARVSALSVEWTIPTVFRNPRDPQMDAGRQHIVDAERLDTIRGALDAFPLAPSLVLDSAGHAVHALWALAAPIDSFSRATALRRDLARTLGANVPDEDEDLTAVSVPLPGSVVREPPYVDVVTCASSSPESVYTLEQMAAAAEKG